VRSTEEVGGTRRAARSDVGLASQGEVCPAAPSRDSDASPTPAPPGSGPRVRELAGIHEPGAGEQIELVAFNGDDGSVSKMAVVRSRLARVVGRYLLGQPIAAGGMATVHLGRLMGPAGFSRTVAVKRMHAELATNPEFVNRFVDEARIASRVRHGNVVQTLDVVVVDAEVLLVLDYVHGESFARLRRSATAARACVPPNVASGIVIGVLRGLHAAHEAKSAKGTPLDLVHCDVSPQNILVGADGVARVLDFGIAKAAGRIHETLTKRIKGKLAYMPPEQVKGEALDRRTDLFAAGVVLWEALAGERLFRGEDAASTMDAIHHREPARLSERELGVTAAVDDVLARALAKDIGGRFDTAMSMARALESALPPASDREIADWVEMIAGDTLRERAALVTSFEGDESGGSKGSLFAAAAGPVSTRRDALVPPPLDSSTEEPATLRGSAASLPTLQIDAAAALAALPPPAALQPEAPSYPALDTPLAMVGPAGDDSNAPESGLTRVAPVERRIRTRTPIPMPFSIPPPYLHDGGGRGRRMLGIAALIVVPALVVGLGILGLRAAADARGARSAATMQALDPPPAPTSIPAAPPNPTPPAEAVATNGSPAAAAAGSATAASAPTPATPAEPAADAKTKASARPRGGRPNHRAPRVNRPIPVAVNR
jgi:serine/threonine-protein kinase